MSSFNVDSLPEELLELILEYVKDAVSPSAFWDCLKTCRQWYRVGLGLYKGLGFATSVDFESGIRRCDIQEENDYADVQLRIKFELEIPSQLYISLLKSLTIHARHQRIAPPPTTSSASSRNDLVPLLEGILQHTRNLTTFSFKVCDGWDFPNLKVPAIPQSLLARLVEALPSTVVNLEIDTAGSDVPPSLELIEKSQDFHLCSQISKVLLRLRHLRLRVGHICNTLLPFQSNAQVCQDAENCIYCSTFDHAICALLRCWSMRTMVIWLPWGQTLKNNSFLRASEALLDSSLRNPTTVLLIHQIDHESPSRTSIINPTQNVYKMFSWNPQSNVAAALRERLDFFNFKPISGHSFKPLTVYDRRISYLKQSSGRTCAEHDTLLTVQSRKFHLSPALGRQPEPGGTSPYSYMAEQTMESMLSWTQNSHLSYRFPMSESDERGKPFWTAQKLFACQFRGCKERCKTLVHLRGHHMYAHPECLHYTKWQGYQPCPVVGCYRIGEHGFNNWQQVDDHLLAHHLNLCTFTGAISASSADAMAS